LTEEADGGENSDSRPLWDRCARRDDIEDVLVFDTYEGGGIKANEPSYWNAILAIYEPIDQANGAWEQ
jgi:hypothetical protein